MKTLSKIFISLIVMTIGFTSASAAQRLFSELNGLDGVQTVYVGKAMMKLGGTASQLGPLANKIDSVEIISIDCKNSIAKARQLLNRIVSEKHLEVMTEANDGNESMVIYGRYSNDNNEGDILDIVIISASEPGQFSIISISGKIPVDQLSSLANGI